jgi:uncharacterized Zn finger protein
MYYDWKPYVPVAKRRQKAKRMVAKLNSAGHILTPVTASRRITTTFWGQAWCQNLERYSDYSNRLPRGRTYLRNGSVIDLKIVAGKVTAQVMGSSLYDIHVTIKAVPSKQWQNITGECAQSIDSLIELLQGQLSKSVMERIARPGAGLFPAPKEITFSCSCPDAAALCKHIAATLYGIGARLDQEPELLFRLRGVDAKELIAKAGEGTPPVRKDVAAGRILDTSKLSDVFGIDLVRLDTPPPRDTPPPLASARKPAKKPASKALNSKHKRPTRKKTRAARLSGNEPQTS